MHRCLQVYIPNDLNGYVYTLVILSAFKPEGKKNENEFSRQIFLLLLLGDFLILFFIDDTGKEN